MALAQMRALQARAQCGGAHESERVTDVLRRLKGTPGQLAEYLRDRNGTPTVANLVGAS